MLVQVRIQHLSGGMREDVTIECKAWLASKAGGTHVKKEFFVKGKRPHQPAPITGPTGRLMGVAEKAKGREAHVLGSTLPTKRTVQNVRHIAQYFSWG